MDGWEGITAYVGNNPLSSQVWDMPCIEKATLPPPPTARRIEDDRSAEGYNAVQSLEERIKHMEAPKPAGKSRGTVSIEFIATIEQQTFLLFNTGLQIFASTQMWPGALGEPQLKASEARSSLSQAPKTLVLCSDQEQSQLLATQAAAWAGLRIVHRYDFNHHDHNDMVKIAPKPLGLVLSILGKCATGPFKNGTWRKVILDTADVLCADEVTLSKYVFFSIRVLFSA